MMILLDTGIVITYFREVDKSSTLLYKLAATHDLAISAITAFEFRVGFRDQEDSFLEEMLSMMQLLPFDENCVSKSVEVYQNLKKRSKLIPVQDIFIASTVLAYHIPIATLNINHFQRIEGIDLWQTS